MAVKIRFKRMGRKKSPFYRIVAIDSAKRQSGREIERLGWFNPISSDNSYSIKEELILKWLKDGAIPSESVKSLFKRIGLSYKWHLINEGKSESEIKKLLEKWLADEEDRTKRKKEKKLAKKAASKKAEDIEVSAEEAPAEEAPAEEAPAEEASVEEAPAEEAPAEEAPAEEAPVEEAPAEEADTKTDSDKKKTKDEDKK